MTAFDQQYLANISATAPGWRRSEMEAAYQVFTSLDEPTGAEEDWRYVEFDHSFADLTPATAAGTPLESGPFVSSLRERSGRVLIVDGGVLEHESDAA